MPLTPAAPAPLEHRADEAHFFSFLQTLLVDGGTIPLASAAGAGSDLEVVLPVSPHSPPASSPSSQGTAPPAPSVSPRARRRPQPPRARRNSAIRALERRSHAKPVRRCITNETYLRRLYLSTRQVAALFSGLSHEMLATMGAGTSTKWPRTNAHVSREFELVDAGGARWPTLCECSLAQGKLHCRLVGGWASFCRANGVATKDDVVFERCRGRPGEIAVRVERKG